jgi:hypothetical protein
MFAQIVGKKFQGKNFYQQKDLIVIVSLVQSYQKNKEKKELLKYFQKN